jgi:hypothetical protein
MIDLLQDPRVFLADPHVEKDFSFLDVLQLLNLLFWLEVLSYEIVYSTC